MEEGARFGHLTVLREVGKDKWGRHRLVECRCDCGTVCVKQADNLKRGKTCGNRCVFRRALRSTHGLYAHPLYVTWRNMVGRCTNPKAVDWAHYGGRGITVCSEWLDVATFIRDMYPTYIPGLQLDRIDNNAGYRKDNCRWATRKENCRNRRNSVLPGWAIDKASENGVLCTTLRRRINRGWDLQRACTEPVHRRKLDTPQEPALPSLP